MASDLKLMVDLVYSLPAIGHSASLATRTPSAGHAQDSKYTPDYGGILEVPGSLVKNNSLSHGLTFQPDKDHHVLKSNSSLKHAPTSIPTKDCIVTLPCLVQDEGSLFSVVKALDEKLYFDVVKFHNQPISYESDNILCLNFTRKIDGVKLAYSRDDHLMVKYDNSVEVISLGSKFKEKFSRSESDDSVAADYLRAGNYSYRIAENSSDIKLKDACINHFNPSLFATACDQSQACQARIYDINCDRSKPSQLISWNVDPKEMVSSFNPGGERILRNRKIRVFYATGPSKRGVQCIDSVSSHLVNMLVTSGTQIALIDPRKSNIGHIYLDKAKVPSFYPNEFLKQTKLSQINDYQFYTLSNIHLRVIDTRYPGVPMSQVNHMQFSDMNEGVNLEVIKHRSTDLETICSSLAGNMSFSTFSQAQNSNLVNPRSVHPPYHDSILESNHISEARAYGLGYHAPSKHETYGRDKLFSIIQMNVQGQLLIKDYLSKESHQDSRNSAVKLETVLSRKKESKNGKMRLNYDSDLFEREVMESECATDQDMTSPLDIDNIVIGDVAEGPSRARERFKSMMGVIDKV